MHSFFKKRCEFVLRRIADTYEMAAGMGGNMNQDYFFSMLAKQIENDFLKEIHGIDACHSNNLYRGNNDWKAAQQNQIGRIVMIIKKIQTLAGNRILVGWYWLLKGMKK